jgi:hypothetical protein
LIVHGLPGDVYLPRRNHHADLSSPLSAKKRFGNIYTSYAISAYPQGLFWPTAIRGVKFIQPQSNLMQPS